jgi:hypothetical protein
MFIRLWGVLRLDQRLSIFSLISIILWYIIIWPYNLRFEPLLEERAERIKEWEIWVTRLAQRQKNALEVNFLCVSSLKDCRKDLISVLPATESLLKEKGCLKRHILITRQGEIWESC